MNKRMTHRCAPVFLRIFQQNHTHTQKCTLVIPKATLPLRHASHPLLWRKGASIKNTPFIKIKKHDNMEAKCVTVRIKKKQKNNNKHSDHPGRLVLGCEGGDYPPIPTRRGALGKIAQQEAPDAAVLSKWETGEVGQAMAGRFLGDWSIPEPQYTKICPKARFYLVKHSDGSAL